MQANQFGRVKTKEEVYSIVESLVEIYGEGISMEILQQNGIGRRTYERCFHSMKELRKTFGLEHTRRTLPHPKNVKYCSGRNCNQYGVSKSYGNAQQMRLNFGLENDGSTAKSLLYYLGEILKEEPITEAKFQGLISPRYNLPLRYDGYFKNYNLLVEYDDISHFKKVYPHQNFERTQEYDLIKNTWAKENGKKLLRFSYKENISKEVILVKLESVGIII